MPISVYLHQFESMTAVLARAWGWVRSWGRPAGSDCTKKVAAEGQKHVFGSQGHSGWAFWLWEGFRCQSEQNSPVEEFWEAHEKLQPMEIEDLCAGKQEMEANQEKLSRWWNKFVPAYILWPSGKRRRKHVGRSGGALDCDIDGDYGTPPSSPTPPSSQISPFRLFANSWKVEIQSEHYEICFNFLRHLFDLFVVGFLWTVSPPAKLILEVLGVQGALRLWFHGMAMFFVSTMGMAGLLWLIQEYLPQFALIYGIIQALVISVSVRQSVMLGVEETKEQDKEGNENDEMAGNTEFKVSLSFKDKMKKM